MVLLLAACAAGPTTQEERLAALEAELASLSDDVGAMAGSQAPVAELQSSMDQLTRKLQGIESASAQAEGHLEETHQASTFEIAVAQYLLDSTGFHDIDEALNESKRVDPAYLAVVRRVHRLMANTPWPEALSADAQTFLDLLAEFEAALEADDGERAAALAAEVHESQHELSHAIEGWLGGAEAADEH
jgi:hypothetical protein